jgi:hypothetical protein
LHATEAKPGQARKSVKRGSESLSPILYPSLVSPPTLDPLLLSSKATNTTTTTINLFLFSLLLA